MPGGAPIIVGGDRAFRRCMSSICYRNASSNDDVLLAGEGLFECIPNSSALTFGVGVRTPAIVVGDVALEDIVGTNVTEFFVVGDDVAGDDDAADDAEGIGESDTGRASANAANGFSCTNDCTIVSPWIMARSFLSGDIFPSVGISDT